MDERRLLLAVALSFLVLIGYRVLFPPAEVPVELPPAEVASQAKPEPTPAVVEPAKGVREQPVEAPEPEATPAPLISEQSERRLELRNKVFSIALTNRGARLIGWELLAYRDHRGRPEEMLRAAPGLKRPLDIETGDPKLDALLDDALFQGPSGTEENRRKLVLEYSDGHVQATKTLELLGGYELEVTAQVLRDGKPVPVQLVWGPGLGNPSAREQEVFGYVKPQAVLMTDGGLQRIPPKKMDRWSGNQPVQWAGVEAMYFTALWVPEGDRGTVRLRASSVQVPGTEDKELLPEVLFELSEGDPRVRLYVGPKDYHTLKPLGHGLARVVPVGDWIGPVVIPLLGLLRWVHGHIGNYGWSIIVLTLLINVAMSPLRHYSIANGVKMAKLSPEMKVIQERYRKVPALDPRRQEMQAEIQALYARHGMSMSTQMTVGCLPILLTMPFLIAFYRVLMVSIDLRGADFLWIPDLSQKDPLYLTPILMGVSMLVMQRMTPTAMDPAQQRIMLIMPVVLVAMFFAAPAGLNLYWLASNLCSIVQQGLTLSWIRRHGHEAPRKRGERKARK
jgi:YidC/Oxa1 family membrane protein insertase